MSNELLFKEGARFEAGQTNFLDGLRAAIDYRGDSTLELKDGTTIEGFLYNLTTQVADLFPRNSPRAVSVNVSDIQAIVFSGEDTASGKSWEDWSKKKELEKAKHSDASAAV